jgi:hypothetical protein
VSFDYGPRPPVTSRRGLLFLLIAGGVLIVACGSWILGPILADSGRGSAVGTIESYRVEVAPSFGTTAQYRPRIAYEVNGRSYAFTAAETVTAPDRRALPVGAHTTVRYDRNAPAQADWVPGGRVVAVNTLAIVGAVIGVILFGAGLAFRALNRVAERSRRPGEGGTNP